MKSPSTGHVHAYKSSVHTVHDHLLGYGQCCIGMYTQKMMSLLHDVHVHFTHVHVHVAHILCTIYHIHLAASIGPNLIPSTKISPDFHDIRVLR